MVFRIIFYKDKKGRNPIEEFFTELGKSNRVLTAKARQGIEKLRYRVYHREPLSKYIEPGVWELRVRARTDVLRILYTFEKGRLIILLHVFVKKQQKILTGELEIARQRLKELKERSVV